MRYLYKIFITFVILMFTVSRCYGESTDKALHFGVSGAINTGLYTVFTGFIGREYKGKVPCLIASSAFTLAIGLGKEVMDANGGYLDGGDMAANLLGVAFSSALIYTLDIHGQEPKQKKLQIGFTGNKAVLLYKW